MSAGGGLVGRSDQELTDDLNAELLHYAIADGRAVVIGRHLLGDRVEVRMAAGRGHATVLARAARLDRFGDVGQAAIGLADGLAAQQDGSQSFGGGASADAARAFKDQCVRPAGAGQQSLETGNGAVLTQNVQQGRHGQSILESSQAARAWTICPCVRSTVPVVGTTMKVSGSSAACWRNSSRTR